MNRKDSMNTLTYRCRQEWPMSPADSFLVWKGRSCRGDDWLYHVLENDMNWTTTSLVLCDSSDYHAAVDASFAPADQDLCSSGHRPDVMPSPPVEPAVSAVENTESAKPAPAPLKLVGPIRLPMKNAPNPSTVDGKSPSSLWTRPASNEPRSAHAPPPEQENTPPPNSDGVVILTDAQRQAYRDHQKALGRVLLGELATLWSRLENPTRTSPLFSLAEVPERLLSHMKKGKKYMEMGFLYGLNVASKKSRAYYYREKGSYEAGQQEFYDSIDTHNRAVLGWR